MPVVTLTKSNSVTRDTYVNESSPTSAGGGSTTLVVGTSTGAATRRRALLYFDLGLIPNDAIINSATLSFLFSAGATSVATKVLKVTGDWDNTTTWNTQPAFDPNPYATFARVINTRISVEIKNLVQEWVDGTSINKGLMLANADESVWGTSTNLVSFDYTSDQPTLTIDYTIPSTGKKCVEYVGTSAFAVATNATSITAHLPTGFQQGDLLIAHVVTSGASATLTAPSGWTKIGEEDTGNGGIRSAIYYKFAAASETSPRFTSSSNIHWNIGISAYRNVKSVKETVGAWASGTQVSPGAITVTATRTLMVLFTSGLNTNSSTPPLSYAELYDSFYGSGGLLAGSSQRYMYDKTTQSNSENITVFSGNTRVTSRAVALEPFANNSPTLVLTSPTDNQTLLSEGNTLPVEGTAGDTDNGNVVTVKFKINGGTARAIASGVSDGSSPISFARTLTYSNKRLWDGSTDVAGVELAEGVDHTLTVWAEDDQGGKSAEITRKFRVIWNRPPTISGTNEDLGTIMVPPSKAYTVTEPEGNPFTITEKINGNVIRSFEGVAGREETVTIPHDLWIRLDLDTPHSLTVEATDSKGLTSTRTFTFTRKETHIEFMLDFDNPDVEAHFTLDGMPKRVLVTLERYLPPGSQIEFVRVCNNAMDETPTWEDATAAVTAGRGYLFTNQEKTAENWRINIWVCIAKGTATERVRLDGFGGAFD
jgi:hypothetical protein